jgi:hypothetical protein
MMLCMILQLLSILKTRIHAHSLETNIQLFAITDTSTLARVARCTGASGSPLSGKPLHVAIVPSG